MQATFSSHERKPEVNISRARAVVSPSIAYKCEERFNRKTAHLLSPSVAQKRCVLKPPNSSFLGRRGGEGRGLRGCRESCYHKQGVALYREKQKEII